MAAVLQFLTTRHDGSEPLDMVMVYTIYVAMIVGGHLGFPSLLLAVSLLRNRYAKNWVFLNFCFAWVIHAVAFSLLFYAGNAVGEEPPAALCLLQSILVYIGPVLASTTLLALVYHLWTTIMNVLEPQTKSSNTRMALLIAMPYIVAFIPGFSAALIATQRPALMHRGPDSFYCSVDFHPQRLFVSILTSFMLFSSLILQAIVAKTLYRHRLILKQVRVQGWELLHLFVRISIFMLVSAGGVIMAVVATIDSSNRARTVYQGIVPLLAYLLFGTRLSFYMKDKPVQTSNGSGKPQENASSPFQSHSGSSGVPP